MQAARIILVVIGLSASCVWAQEEPKPDQLKKMYDDALVQLKTAQDRKNELANQNEALAAKVKELEQKLAETVQRADALSRESAACAERTFVLRSHYAAFQAFLKRYPELQTRWRLFLGNGVTVPRPPEDADERWPLAERPASIG